MIVFCSFLAIDRRSFGRGVPSRSHPRRAVQHPNHELGLSELLMVIAGGAIT
jgi:hypothetical protein